MAKKNKENNIRVEEGGGVELFFDGHFYRQIFAELFQNCFLILQGPFPWK